MAFVKALRVALDSKGMKPADIASDTTTPQHLSKLMNERVKDPTWEKACAIISALGMAPNSFRALATTAPSAARAQRRRTRT